jgi:hypothetical protein
LKYKIGAFKIEEISQELKDLKKNRGLDLDLENKVDVCTSSWCFRHLADPLGTYAQTYNLIRPQIGFFFVDGFFFVYENEILSGQTGDHHMTQLFLDTHAPFMTTYSALMKSLNHFVLRRPDERSCQFPMEYIGVQEAGYGYQIGSNCVTEFKRAAQKEDCNFSYPQEYYSYYGYKSMYDWFKENHLLVNETYTWKPIYEKEDIQGSPALHAAVAIGDIEVVAKYLKNGADINESDNAGKTALHIAIEKQNVGLFKLLMDKGADFNLSDGNGNRSIHTAAFFDVQGTMLQMLIDAGADPNHLNRRYRIPIDRAIEAVNLKAIEILLKSGVKLSEEHHKSLQDPVFSPLHDQRIIPSS